MPEPLKSDRRELDKELALLSEDQKVMRFMEMLNKIEFGDLTIRKHKGKIVSYFFKGEILFKIPEFKKGS